MDNNKNSPVELNEILDQDQGLADKNIADSNSNRHDTPQDEEQKPTESDELKAKCESYWDQLTRTTAEFENYKKRANKDIENTRNYAIEYFATELLDVHDGLIAGNDLCENHKESLPPEFLKGFELTLSQMKKLFEKIKISEVNPEGEKFNPDFHQAMGICEDEKVEKDYIGQVLQKGYLLQGRLLRPALVTVKK